MFETAIAGSLPKPSWLAETEKLWPEWKSSGAELERAKADATLLWLKVQEDAGHDIVGDGEQSRQHFVHGFLEQVDGIDFENKVRMGIRNNRYDAMVPQVVAPLRLRGRVHEAEARLLRAHTRRETKFTLPGPMTIVDTGRPCPDRDRLVAVRADPAQAWRSETYDRKLQYARRHGGTVPAGASEAQLDEALERIFNQPDFLGSRWLADGAKRCDAVARLVTTFEKGTGFLTSPWLLMTNNHVLPDAATHSTTSLPLGPRRCRSCAACDASSSAPSTETYIAGSPPAISARARSAGQPKVGVSSTLSSTPRRPLVPAPT